MAALSERHAESVVELRDLTAPQIAAMLEEETGQWRHDLDWDFRSSADLVRRFVEMRALTGFALLDGARVLGYSYYVIEEGKALIGDLYVRAAYRTAEREGRLLSTVLDAVWQTPGATRVEAQLLMMESPVSGGGSHAPANSYFSPASRALYPEVPPPLPSPAPQNFPRLFLEAPLNLALSLEPREIPGAFTLPWVERRQDEAADVIVTAYQGHIDSHINDQYRSPAGARRFLTNIVQYPGCGSFFPPASYLAEDRFTGHLCGMSLASLVADGVGHITQVCVTPGHRGTGLGYELLRRSLLSLAARGCRTVSLTVTTANEEAVRLYRHVGFRTRRQFAAHVWEKR